MITVISHGSALEYWRNQRANAGTAGLHIVGTALQLPEKVLGRSDLEAVCPELSRPLHILVSSKNNEQVTPLRRVHVSSGGYPAGCFVKVGDEVYVSSPELCFLQMARSLPLVGAIALGFELCGSYSLKAAKTGLAVASGVGAAEPRRLAQRVGSGAEAPPLDRGAAAPPLDRGAAAPPLDRGAAALPLDRGAAAPAPSQIGYQGQLEQGFCTVQPITSTARIASLVEKMEGTHGCKKAIRALRYVLDASASPMETALAMLLCLPYQLGGYGLSQPTLNQRVDVAQKYRRAASKAYYVCDLYWPRARVAAEYDSKTYHTQSQRISEDAMKRNALAYMGIEIVSVTSRQLYSVTEFERVALLLGKRIGKRIHSGDDAFLARQLQLRRLVL